MILMDAVMMKFMTYLYAGVEHVVLCVHKVCSLCDTSDFDENIIHQYFWRKVAQGVT